MAGQSHTGQQRGHFAGAVFVHLPGVVQARFNQFVANRLGHFGHHIARRCMRIAQRPFAQAIQMAHLPRPDTRRAQRRFLTPVAGHAQHMGRIAGRKAGIDRQAFALQARNRAGQVAVIHIGGF